MRFTLILALAMGACIVLVIGAAPAHAQSQVALTLSYSVIGGTQTNSDDVLTYVSNGVQDTAVLSGTPTVYMVDSGTAWTTLSLLNGSTSSQQWETSQDVSGVITSPLTVSFTFYHQYWMTFDYNVTNAGVGYSGPDISYVQAGAEMSGEAPLQTWADAGSSYSYGSQLPGTSSTEEWVLKAGVGGIVSGPGTATADYYHMYLVTASYSILNGGSPAAPVLSSTEFDAPTQLTMGTLPQQIWLDAGANYTFTGSLSAPANERWIGTIPVQTQSGKELTMVYNGTVASALTLTPVYYNQFLVTVDFVYVPGTLDVPPPSFAYQTFDARASVDQNGQVWVDAGSPYTLPSTICCTALPSSEQWVLDNSSSGTITQGTTIESTYYQQYKDYFSFSIVGQQPPSQTGDVELSFVSGGITQQLGLLESPQSAWADAGSSYSAASLLSGSGSSERWYAASATGMIEGPEVNYTIDIAYTQQYLLTIDGGGLSSQWVDAGANTTLSTPALFGRSEGTGYRVVAYQIGSSAIVDLTTPVANVTVEVSMTGPQTIRFQSVPQFEVSLDAGATGALDSITPPTVPGDTGWYDQGSPVQVYLTGVYGRAHGVGHLITSVSATNQETLQVDTLAAFLAYNTSSLSAPVTIATSSETQYQVVLNPAASQALVSITPGPSFAGDTGWYDSGSPAVTVVLEGVYSRSDGVGMRTTSWILDSAGSVKVDQTGDITIQTKAINSVQYVNATSTVQYQVTLDKGASEALVSMTPPTVSGDTGWYDSGTTVAVILNGEWGRAAGTGSRLSGYSLNGGSNVAVQSKSPVDVLDNIPIGSAEAITTVVVTQYQVSLDSGATAAISSITSPSIPSDSYWYDSGTPVTVVLNGVWGRTASSGDRLTTYSVNGGASNKVDTSSTVQVLSLAGISSPQAITSQTTTQYHVTSSPEPWTSITTPSILNDSGWYDAGTSVVAKYNDSWGLQGGTRESIVSWAANGGSKTIVTRSGAGTFQISMTMTSAQSIVLTSVQQYSVTVVGPQKVTATPASPTGDYFFDEGSSVAFTTSRTWNGTEPGMRNVLTSYTVDGGNATAVQSSATATTFTTPSITFNAPQNLTFNAQPQYQVTFSILDGTGSAPIQPTQIQLSIGNSTVNVSGETEWLANGTSFKVSGITWDGTSVGPVPPPSYFVKAAPLSVTLDADVYPISFKVTDLLGLPVSGAGVSITLANGTSFTGSTNSAGVYSSGMVPGGPYTAKVTSLAGTTRINGDAGAGESVTSVKVPLSIISLFVIVAAAAGAGAGGFVLVRKRRGRVSDLK